MHCSEANQQIQTKTKLVSLLLSLSLFLSLYLCHPQNLHIFATNWFDRLQNPWQTWPGSSAVFCVQYSSSILTQWPYYWPSLENAERDQFSQIIFFPANCISKRATKRKIVSIVLAWERERDDLSTQAISLFPLFLSHHYFDLHWPKTNSSMHQKNNTREHSLLRCIHWWVLNLVLVTQKVMNNWWNVSLPSCLSLHLCQTTTIVLFFPKQNLMTFLSIFYFYNSNSVVWILFFLFLSHFPIEIYLFDSNWNWWSQNISRTIGWLDPLSLSLSHPRLSC